MMPRMSVWVPNRITCAGRASGSASSWSNAWSQVGSTSPVSRVDVVVAVPHREAVRVDVDGLVVGRPPHLHVGGLDDLAEGGPGDGAADRGVQMRGEPFLGFDGGEVLHLVAGGAAQVLPEPVDQLREVQRIQRRPPIVIAARDRRGAGAGDDRPVGRQGQGEEHRRPIRRAVGGGERLPDRPVLLRHPRQIRGVLAAPGRPHPPILTRAHRRRSAWSSSRSWSSIGCGRFGFVVAVPAFGALLHPQHPGLLRTRRADGLAGRPAGDRDRRVGAGVAVEDAADHRPDTHLLRDGQLPRHRRRDPRQVATSTGLVMRPTPDRSAGTCSWTLVRGRVGRWCRR